jgi:GABA(A) receptor-associated protein
MESIVFTPHDLERITKKYPGRLPVFVFRLPTATDVPDIAKHKYLVPSEITVGNFMHLIRKQIKLTPEKSLFLFIDNVLPAVSQTMTEVYNQYKREDGTLRMYYTSENTFG